MSFNFSDQANQEDTFIDEITLPYRQRLNCQLKFVYKGISGQAFYGGHLKKTKEIFDITKNDIEKNFINVEAVTATHDSNKRIGIIYVKLLFLLNNIFPEHIFDFNKILHLVTKDSYYHIELSERLSSIKISGAETYQYPHQIYQFKISMYEHCKDITFENINFQKNQWICLPSDYKSVNGIHNIKIKNCNMILQTYYYPSYYKWNIKKSQIHISAIDKHGGWWVPHNGIKPIKKIIDTQSTFTIDNHDISF